MTGRRLAIAMHGQNHVVRERFLMSEDPETIGLRPMVVDGQVQADDYEVVWRGLSIGRILKQPHSRHWWWGCNVYGQSPTPGDRGAAIDFKDCQVRFKLAWARIRPTLTEQDIATAVQHAERLAQQRQSQDQCQAQPPVQVLDNQRAAPRQRVLKSGIIEFNGGTIDCVVRNISETGTALDIASPIGIPPEFNLLLSGTRTHQRCRVVWRAEKRIGVAFE